MILNTTSSVISFAKQLEIDTGKYYEEMAERYPEVKDECLTFAKENGKAINRLKWHTTTLSRMP